MTAPDIPVLVAGIGGASLGTELLKCLLAVRGYRVYGCDISPLAYGHYQPGFQETFVVRRETYTDDLLTLCQRLHVRALIAGADEPAVLLAEAAPRFADLGVLVAGNSAGVVRVCTDKSRTFAELATAGFAVPKTFLPTDPTLRRVQTPLIVKPATGSGGSSHVFFARSGDEALDYVALIERTGRRAVVQEYLAEGEGEFTVGVLSLPGGRVVGSVALRRFLTPKLSHTLRGEGYVISSGYSQGLIDDFPEVRRVAESIARALGSEGPLNVQGRIKSGRFVPFEINARFSASTYLRALAGFNEAHLFLGAMLEGHDPVPEPLRPGYYLRSLAEVHVPVRDLRG